MASQARDDDALRQQQEREANAVVIRTFVSQLLAVHNSVKAAQLRLNAHGSVKSYGDEIRNTIIPARTAMSHLISDVKVTSAIPIDMVTPPAKPIQRSAPIMNRAQVRAAQRKSCRC